MEKACKGRPGPLYSEGMEHASAAADQPPDAENLLSEDPEGEDELTKGEEELDDVGFDDPGDDTADALETGGPSDEGA